MWPPASIGSLAPSNIAFATPSSAWWTTTTDWGSSLLTPRYKGVTAFALCNASTSGLSNPFAYSSKGTEILKVNIVVSRDIKNKNKYMESLHISYKVSVQNRRLSIIY